MKRAITETLISIVTAFLLTGCMIPIPGRNETATELSGRILDSANKSPISHAAVMMKDRPDTTSFTDGTGRFHMRSVKELYLIKITTPCPTYYIPRPRPWSPYLEISHTNYETLCLDLRQFTNTNNIWPRQLEDIQLMPQTGNQ